MSTLQKEVGGEPFILLDKHSGLRRTTDDMFESMGISPNVVLEAEECNAVLTFVSLDFGISIIPQVPALKNSNVATLKIEKPYCTRTVFIAWIENKYIPSAVKRFRDFVIETSDITCNKI